MKLFSKICTLLVALLVLGSVGAFAENYAWTPDLKREDVYWTPNLQREVTPELGDSSIATVALVGLAGLALTGAVVAHKKARSNAR